MQEGDRPIEFGLCGLDAGNRKVDGAELFGGELVVVMFVRTGDRGAQEKRTQTGHPAHRASECEPCYGESRLQNRGEYERSRSSESNPVNRPPCRCRVAVFP